MKILIIEDSLEWQTRYRAELPSTIEIIQARNLESANTAIEQLAIDMAKIGLLYPDIHPIFDAIVVDGCLYGGDFDTPPLVKRIKAIDFPGPVIAGSSSPRLNLILMTFGCTHNAKIKENVSRLLLDVLKL